jgi:ketosteroid isomerase-like protein
MTDEADKLSSELEEANARFYRAFEQLQIAEMDAVWAHSDDVKCVHPGWPLLTGWAAVRASWEAIFASTAEMRFTLSDVRVVAAADFGWVTCTENILSEAAGRVAVTSILATNLFERAPDGWRLIHHHASHVFGGPR